MLIETIEYREGRVLMIDQKALPLEEKILEVRTASEMAEAIKNMSIRGAPAIGIAAAYGMLLAVEENYASARGSKADYLFDREKGVSGPLRADITAPEMEKYLSGIAEMLMKTRPTAVNLSWALKRMMSVFDTQGADFESLCEALAKTAFGIYEEEIRTEKRIGINGSRYIEDGMNILTHCNAGGLATAGYGTALALVYRAYEEGKRVKVFADETRPLLQGARLTAWELNKNGIEVEVLCDGAAASLFSEGEVDCVIVGADRISRNGDTANKIGTFSLAVLSKEFSKPFYVAAPISTFDPYTSSGSGIPIEKRSADEVSVIGSRRIVPVGVGIYNPAFDVTPAEYISAIITEEGVLEKPFDKSIAALFDGHRVI